MRGTSRPMWNQIARWSMRVVVVVAGAGCARPAYTEVRPVPEVTCKEWQGHTQTVGCFPPNCIGNSPAANTFPINGLSAGGSGACNASGLQLVPGSLAGGGCPSGTSLTIDATGKRLVGTRSGAVVCERDQLAGATFAIRSASATLSLAIANVRRFTVDRETFEGYRIESGGAPACDPAVADRVVLELGPGAGAAAPRPQRPVVDGYQPGRNDDLVIAVAGPVYDDGDRPVPGSGAGTFNLACVGDALAKRSLYHLYSSDDDRNETALKMLTANYCGRSFTLRGAQIEWFTLEGRWLHEAGWLHGTAQCIDTPRLMMLEVGGSRISPEDLPGELQPHGCEPTAGGRGTCDQQAWIDALRAECKLAACDATARAFESYVEKDGLVVERK